MWVPGNLAQGQVPLPLVLGVLTALPLSPPFTCTWSQSPTEQHRRGFSQVSSPFILLTFPGA